MQNRLFPFKDKIDAAIELIRQYEPEEGYFLAFSGGKDSIVIYDLAVKAGVKFDAHYNNTQIDPPELRLFVKRNYSNVDWIQPKKSMFQLIEERRMFPTRTMRFCCYYLKEQSGKNRVLILGIRGAESIRRSKRNAVEKSVKGNKLFINPIFDWTDEDVWGYIRGSSLQYCKLYDEGWTRIGCIGCPMGTKANIIREFEKYPSIKNAYLRAIKKGLENKPNNYFGTNYELMFEWWMSQLGIKEFFRLKNLEQNHFLSNSVFVNS